MYPALAFQSAASADVLNRSVLGPYSRWVVSVMRVQEHMLSVMLASRIA